MGSPVQSSPETKRQKFQRWTRDEQDLWTDFFETYSELLIEARIGDDTDRLATSSGNRSHRDAIFEDEIESAARLADKAIQELQYRFWIQTSQRPKERKR